MVGQKGKAKGKLVADSARRDTENVSLAEDVEAYFAREVLPHAPDAWIDADKTKVGYTAFEVRLERGGQVADHLAGE